MASNKAIANKLHEYYETRDRLKKLRGELVKMSVECGQLQEDAMKGNVAEYLDGYLAGAGVLPVARMKTA